MTTISHVLPKILVKDGKTKARLFKNKGFDLDQNRSKCKSHKYDHYAMLMDRIGGMKWLDVSKKHNVPNDPYGHVARTLALHSSASNKLKPEHVKKLFDLGEYR